jgi:hypothetical protein
LFCFVCFVRSLFVCLFFVCINMFCIVTFWFVFVVFLFLFLFLFFLSKFLVNSEEAPKSVSRLEAAAEFHSCMNERKEEGIGEK